MPWEKTFDVEEVTEKAMLVFWSKGFQATSISDLVAGMGINKGSLYNAFGSKKALFDRALLKYDNEHRRARLSEFSRIENSIDALGALFDDFIEESIADTEFKGCMLINTALDLPNLDPDIRVKVTSAITDFEMFFETLIIRGQERYEIPKNIDPKPKSKALMALVVGLRVMVRGVFSTQDLYAVKNEALKSISMT